MLVTYQVLERLVMPHFLYVEFGLELMFIGVWKIYHTQIKECCLYSVFCYNISMLLGDSILGSMFKMVPVQFLVITFFS